MSIRAKPFRSWDIDELTDGQTDMIFHFENFQVSGLFQVDISRR